MGFRRVLTRYLALALAGLAASSLWAQPAFAACKDGVGQQYTFEGTVTLEHNGNRQPLEGVGIKVVTKRGLTRGVAGVHGRTDASGYFRINCQFTASAPGTKRKHDFRVLARFRDAELKIRKGGWFKNNWHAVGSTDGCNGSGKPLISCNDQPDRTDKTFNTNTKEGKHAYLFWFYSHLQDEMRRHGLGLHSRPVFSKRLAVTFPDKSIISDGSWFLFNIHIADNDWDDHRILIHEWMHRWDVGSTSGEGHIACLGDFTAHHEHPDNNRHASRCSGYMEGFAEATAQRLTTTLPDVNNDYRAPRTLGDLQGANPPIDSLRDAQRTDTGWENFLKLFWTNNEWAAIGGNSGWQSDCDPPDISVIQMLQTIRRADPNKGGPSPFHTNATFQWFADTMANHHGDMDQGDADLYAMMGNPGNSPRDIYDQECGGSTGTATGGLNPAANSEQVERAAERIEDGMARPDATDMPDVAAPAKFAGLWATDYGELNLHQVRGYVIGDYADNGVMLGKVSGNCVAGVFTNGDRNGVFRFAKDGSDGFSGEWAWHGNKPSKEWNGQRKGSASTKLNNFTRDDEALETMSNDREVFDGTYRSSYGKLDLIQRDLFLIGDYADNGIIAALWDGNSFRGYFTNGSRTGWLDFAFLSKNGDFRSGEWNWVGESKAKDWTVRSKSAGTPSIDNVTEDVSCR